MSDERRAFLWPTSKGPTQVVRYHAEHKWAQGCRKIHRRDVAALTEASLVWRARSLQHRSRRQLGYYRERVTGIKERDKDAEGCCRRRFHHGDVQEDDCRDAYEKVGTLNHIVGLEMTPLTSMSMCTCNDVA